MRPVVLNKMAAVSNLSDFELIFDGLQSLINQLDSAEYPNNDGFDRAQYLTLLGNDYYRTLSLLKNHTLAQIDSLADHPESEEEREGLAAFFKNVDELSSILSSLIQDFTEKSLEENDEATTEIIGLELEEQGDLERRRIGRPRLCITQCQLEAFDYLGFSVTKCANILGVSRHTIINRRTSFGMPPTRERYSQMSDTELDEMVSQMMNITPNVGERYTNGYLKQHGINVQKDV